MPGSILGKDHLIVNKVRRKQTIQLDLPGGGSRHTGGKWSQTSKVSNVAHVTRKWVGFLLQCGAVSLFASVVTNYRCYCFQSLSRVRLFATPWTAARQVFLSFTISQSFFKLMSIELVMPSNHLILCCPLFLPSIFPSIRVFSRVSSLYQVAKVLALHVYKSRCLGEGIVIFLWLKRNALSCVQIFATPWTIQFMHFSRPEYWRA